MPNPDSVWPDLLQDLMTLLDREGESGAAITDSSDELDLDEQGPASSDALAFSSRVVQ